MNQPARRAGDRLTGAPTAARCCASTSAQGRRWSSRKASRTRSRSPSWAMPASSPSALSAPMGVCRLPRTVEAITLAHDGDDPDAKPAAAQAYHRGVVRYLGQGLTLRMTAPPTGCDPNDVLKHGGPDALKKLLTEARCDLGKFDDAAFLDEVCRLDDLAYDRARVTALKLLGLSKLDTLDKLRTATRKRWAETPGSTEIPPVPDDDQPWPEPVTDIGPVLDAALEELARYVIAPLHRLATAVLWSAYVHLLPRADLGIDVAPRLGIRSKVKGSGKSTLLECVDNLAPNPVIAGSITPSSIFRIIDATRATLLLDEADHIVNKNSSPDLLAILNSGHRRRTAYVIRSVPTEDGGWVPVKFNTFTGIAFAGLETLPETLQDRSIGLPLHRATREREAGASGQRLQPRPHRVPPQVRPLGRRPHGASGRDHAAGAVQPSRRQLARPVQHCGSGRRPMAGTAPAGGDGGRSARRTATSPCNCWRRSGRSSPRRRSCACTRRSCWPPLMNIEEAPWETANRRPRDRRVLAPGKAQGLPAAASGSRRGGGAPALPRNGGRETQPPQRYTEEHLREAWWRYLERKPPSETPRRPATDPQRMTPACSASEANAAGTSEPAAENEGDSGPASGRRAIKRGRGPHQGERCAQWTRTGAAPDPPERGEAVGEA